jgi:hypothetical protein
MAERAAAECRKHTRFVAADFETITDAGALAHELEDRSIAEVDRRAPQAMAERTDLLHAQVCNGVAQPVGGKGRLRHHMPVSSA